MTFRHTVAVAAMATLASAALAADVAVFPIQPVNLTPSEAEAIGTVLAQAYGRVSKAEVLLPQQAGPSVKTPGDLPGAAASLGVREYIETSAVGLLSRESEKARSSESRIIIQAARRMQNGELVYRAELTATSLGDVEIVAERLARALYEKKPAEDTGGLRTVTRREGTRDNRTFTEKIMGVKVGMTWLVAKNSRFDPLISIGFDGRLEGRSYFLEFGAGVAIPKSVDEAPDIQTVGLLYGDIGGSYYFTDTSISPYAGGGISPRVVITEGGGMNLALYGQGGVMFMRESSTRLYVDLRVSQNVLPVTGHLDDGTTRGKQYPTEIGLQVGIGW
jgi:hypothetical protein